MKRVLSCVLFALMAATTDAGTIGVNSQQDFDLLSTDIVKLISKGEKDFIVNINAKELTFADNQITLKSIKRPDTGNKILNNQTTGKVRFETKHP